MVEGFKLPQPVWNTPNDSSGGIVEGSKKWSIERATQEYEDIRSRARKAKIRTSEEYDESRKSNNAANLPSASVLRRTPQFKIDDWKGFLGENYSFKPPERMWSVERVERHYEELRETLKNAGIVDANGYRNALANNKKLDIPSRKALYKARQFQETGWSGLFGGTQRDRWSVERVEKEYSELKEKVRRAEIRTPAEYVRRYKSLNLPSPPVVNKSKQFRDENWDGFLSREPRNNGASILNQIDRSHLNPTTDEGQVYQQLVFALGPEAARDLLYAMRPEISHLPVEDIGGRLSRYLGDYRSPQPFPIGPALDNLVPLLDHIQLQELLLASIKRECQRAYFKARKAADAPDSAPVQEYFADLRSHITESSQQLEDVLAKAENYFLNQVLGDLPLPDRVVPFLTEGRPFPDIYQRININEIRTHQRFLIADEMGVGKSASAILAKESMGMRCALIVAPDTVCEQWAKYLSDKVENGKKVGYFIKKEENDYPNVLIIKSRADLARLQEETFDYVIISREKMNDHNTEALGALDFDMLIADEVHQYKRGEKGTYSRNLIKLAGRIDEPDKRFVMLSGTPVPNKVQDVAMLIKLLHPEFKNESTGSISRAVLQGDMLAARANLLPLMQMKSLADHIDMPGLSIETVSVQLSPAEEHELQNILQTDSLDPQTKMMILRQYLLNPETVMDVPDLESSKIKVLKYEITEALETKNKIVVFVNDYIEDVIRGDSTIIEKLGLPADVQAYVVHGDNSKENGNRQNTRDRFRDDTRPSVLFMSGKTDNVGVDYSYADHVIFYNEPWNYAGFLQQLARVYRPGLKDALTCRVLVTKGTLEEGIFDYIRFKHGAIEKLLRGVPLSREEHDVLQQDIETEGADDVEVNPELPNYYKSRYDEIMRMFGHTKGRGQEQFFNALKDGGKGYAEIYEMFGGRSYQDNAARVCSNLIKTMAEERGVVAPDILDMGSGPAMFRRRSVKSMQDNTVSLDLNRLHFEGKKLGMTVVGSFTDIPFPNSQHFDFVNCSFAIQDTSYQPEKGDFERIQVFAESMRMLKMNGRFVVNMIYTTDFRDEAVLGQALEKLGFRIVPEYTGEAASGDNYKSRVLVYEKVSEPDAEFADLIATFSPKELRAFQFLNKEKQSKKTTARKRPTQQDRIVSSFTLNGRTISIEFNEDDQKIRMEEQKIIDEVQAMKDEFSPTDRSVLGIPKEVLIQRGFSRLKTGKLFKRVPGDGPITLE